ncbi:Predicted ATPase [Chitinophaga eiseniae]|uniref:Predicted ATPase n=1 Tax=Chitinophaga eiseniae TaxID=634771 RepID=A0A1T4MXN2_9BACT|nr:AAA family ATPase [Chitinophaga eiseniae]SJZ71547.1 Predicted ATPase [Chitinophaga eiseniae]
MSKIRIKHFGPIVEGYTQDDGWIDIRKATVLIGNQGSGKSTVAKLISTFTWIEKALVRGDYPQKWFERKNKLKNQYLPYHRLENYLKSDSSGQTEIDFQGEAYSIKYRNGSLIIEEISHSSYPLPQIMYVPAERNFITYMKTAKELKLSSPSMQEFLTEFDKAKENLKAPEPLPINSTAIEYDKLNDTLNLRGTDYKLRLSEASSGFQSLVPLYLVSSYLANSILINRADDLEGKDGMTAEEMERFKKGVAEIWTNESFTDEQRRLALSVLAEKFNKSAFINIVEEPEQNLFPGSQWEMLQSLLGFNSMAAGNKLILTTHSPYIINFLNIAILGYDLREKIKEANRVNDLLPKLQKIVKENSLISSEDVVVYQLDEKEGVIRKLPAPEGIPTDKNLLNMKIREANQLFDALLEIEEDLAI